MISTHVLDTSQGRPADGVTVTLERQDGGAWRVVGRGVTDRDGRVKELASGDTRAPGTFRLTFETGPYFSARGMRTFYPSVTVLFEVRDVAEHHHVPLLVSPFGYSTYRGT
jgi:5-hydroxyisourate hydrolase